MANAVIDTLALDRDIASRIRENCSSGDKEGNGCQLDKIMLGLLLRLGLMGAADAFLAVEAWRA